MSRDVMKSFWLAAFLPAERSSLYWFPCIVNSCGSLRFVCLSHKRQFSQYVHESPPYEAFLQSWHEFPLANVWTEHYLDQWDGNVLPHTGRALVLYSDSTWQQGDSCIRNILMVYSFLDPLSSFCTCFSHLYHDVHTHINFSVHSSLFLFLSLSFSWSSMNLLCCSCSNQSSILLRVSQLRVYFPKAKSVA